MYQKTTKELIEFINACPTPYHANATVKAMLDKEGFIELTEGTHWDLVCGKKYYVSKNTTALIAFEIGSSLDNYSFNISASHCDTPTFKIKPLPTIKTENIYTKLNVEMYGGALCAPWFDRPLSIAGRVIVKKGNQFKTRLINVDQDLLIIPNLAIHLNREANKGESYNNQIHMLPLFGSGKLDEQAFNQLIAKELQEDIENIYASELFLYPRCSGTMIGVDQEYVGSPRLDDLQCVFSTLKGFIQGNNPQSINVFYMADNEEVGSHTKQGAASTFLKDTLKRINNGLHKTDEDYYRALAASMIVSADNAHAVHPNQPSLSDPVNRVLMNSGVVIKHSARQSYTTDAMSAALFIECCKKAGVPYQSYTNRSDLPGGGTLGSISEGQVSIHSVDIGLAQLAMHSCFELAGSKDTHYAILAMKEFYSHHLSEIAPGIIAMTK
ncbi:MAG: M18 family aminopeptidase [Erysipelotrichaceae bacterium]|nr:M18 family aminopeptidase [Erysipelotrichaceae bacterium]